MMQQKYVTPSFEHILKAHYHHLSSMHVVTRFSLSEFCLLCLLKIDQSLYEGATELSVEEASLKQNIRKWWMKQHKQTQGRQAASL